MTQIRERRRQRRSVLEIGCQQRQPSSPMLRKKLNTVGESVRVAHQNRRMLGGINVSAAYGGCQ